MQLYWRDTRNEILPEEIWKQIPPPYKNRYLASSLGRIKSLANWKRTRGGTLFMTKEIILRQHINREGYLMVKVYDGKGGKKTTTVHKLIGAAFKKKVKGKKYINHDDGIKLNNKENNLVRCTFSENILHAIRTGLNPMEGETSCSAKLTNKEAIEIFNSKLGHKKLEAMYNISQTVVYGIKTGRIWGHLTGKKYKRRKPLLNKEQKLEIFNSDGTFTSIAKKYKISFSYVSNIKRGKIASNITGKQYVKTRKW